MKSPILIGLILTLNYVAALHADVPAGYVLQWADEFDYTGAPDPEKWTHEVGGNQNGEVQTYTDSLDNSRVEEGRLIIEAQQSFGTRVPSYTSARLVTRDKGEWKFGRMEARIKLPKVTGTWPAFWMLSGEEKHGDALWPDNGEIDIMEAVGYEQDPLYKTIAGNQSLPNVHGTIHTSKRNGLENSGIGGSTYLPDLSDDFHVFAVNWTDGRIEWEVDGVNYFTIERDPLLPVRNPPEDPWEWWPFDQDFFIILNLAIGGNWGGHFKTEYYANSPYGGDGIDHEAVWPQRMEVDYVRVYAQSEGSVWKGLPVDANGNADTGSWMGWINVNKAPWLYSFTLEKYFYSAAALEDTFSPDNSWVYFPH